MSSGVEAIQEFRYVMLTWAGGDFGDVNIFTAAEARELMASIGRAADEAERFEQAADAGQGESK